MIVLPWSPKRDRQYIPLSYRIVVVSPHSFRGGVGDSHPYRLSFVPLPLPLPAIHHVVNKDPRLWLPRRLTQCTLSSLHACVQASLWSSHDSHLILGFSGSLLLTHFVYSCSVARVSSGHIDHIFCYSTP